MRKSDLERIISELEGNAARAGVLDGEVYRLVLSAGSPINGEPWRVHKQDRQSLQRSPVDFLPDDGALDLGKRESYEILRAANVMAAAMVRAVKNRTYVVIP